MWMVSLSGLPKMGGTSTSLMMFIRAEPMTLTRTDTEPMTLTRPNNAGEDPQSDMKNGTLKVEPVSVSRYSI